MNHPRRKLFESRLRVVFAGTPEFAAPSLQALLDYPAAEVVAVYTQPDRPAGRGQKLSVSPIKALAVAHGLPVEQPLNWKTADVVARFAAYRPDLLLVAAYGIILPAPALQIPTLGALNVHASLLPRWRGAAPIQRALMAGDEVTGVTIMQVVPALDAGPMLLKRRCAITSEDTAGSLERKLALLGATALRETLDALRDDRLTPLPQTEADVTYAAKITRADRNLDFTQPAEVLARQVRALSPTPLAHTEILGLAVNVLRSAVVAPIGSASPGAIVHRGPAGIDIATAHACLRLLEVQPLGKRPMSIKDFLNGYGSRLAGGA